MPIDLTLKPTLLELQDDQERPDLVLFAFDANNKLLATQPLRDKTGISLPDSLSGQTVRLFVGPKVDDDAELNIERLERLGALERRLKAVPNASLEFEILPDIWRGWFFCSCTVRGRVVKRVTRPDGSVSELPICFARVNVCEVDRLPRFIIRLPDPDIFRLRDELVRHVLQPIPLPDPPDLRPRILPIDPRPQPRPQPLRPDLRPSLRPELRAELRPELIAPPERISLNVEPRLEQEVRLLALTSSPTELRRRIVDLSDLLLPLLCVFDWLDPFFRLEVDCLKTVEVDETGHFQTVIHYPCFGDKPDLYFSVEQLIGGAWQTIYAPSVRCSTRWDYECGSEVTLTVTNPAAQPCEPDIPVDNPPGDRWVMPFAVGATKIWGIGRADAAAAGWVKQDGLTDYSGIVNAPFGGTLGLRLGHSNSIPDSAIKYYRWSYRKSGTTSWAHLTQPVVRHYVKQSPGQLPSFPTYQLGPRTIGSKPALFEFRPLTVPSSEQDPSDPAGTTLLWPIDNFFASDIYSGFFETAMLAGDVAVAAGQYELLLELFDPTGNLVTPSSTTFQFIVPESESSSGNVTARAATSAEISGGGFLFRLHIDNNPCTAAIEAPSIGSSAVADACGFLRYTKTSAANAHNIRLAFDAAHPNGHATFSFDVVRGASAIGNVADAGGEVTAASANGYTRSGTTFARNFSRDELLESCNEGAFAESLYVRAKATNGHGSHLSGLDASALRAFALAPGS